MAGRSYVSGRQVGFSATFGPYDAEPVVIDAIRRFEASEWLDPRTGRVEVGSVAMVVLDHDLVRRLPPTGTLGVLSVRLVVRDEPEDHPFGRVRLAGCLPSFSVDDPLSYRIVFEPAGRS